MPPPFNVMILPMWVLFYLIETPIGWILKLWHQDRHYSYDLLLPLMPSFLKVRTLQIDDQILYENCNRLWEINTNDGLKYGKMVRFNSS